MSPDEPRPALDPAEILAQRAWMRRFAAELAGAEGEDLAQETWLRVLARPGPALAQPRAWLASVMRNGARMRARGEARRALRERRVARDEAQRSTDELAAQAELEQLAVRAVLELDAPYRETLLLRYVRGLEPHEIAARLGVPASTVRNRVARGLELVRVRLDARHGGERGAWAAVLVPALGVGTSLTGGALVSAQWVTGVVAVGGVVAILWFQRPAHERALVRPLAAEAPPVELRAPEAQREAPASEARAASGSERIALPALTVMPVAAGTTELIVTVTWARDGSPAADVPLRIESLDVEPYPLATLGTTDSSGTARFAALPPGEQDIDTLRGASASVELDGHVTDNGEPQTLELAIPLGLDVACRVVDRAGAGVPGAEVWLSDFGNTSSGIVVGRTDAGGWLLLRDLPGEHRTLAALAAGHAPSTQREFRGQPGARLEVELVLPGPGASLVGVAQDESGTPLAGVELLLGAEFPDEVQRADGQGVAQAPPRRATSDADGRFQVHGLASGPLELQARAPGFATARANVELAPDATESCTLVLPPEARVAGVARDIDGRPLAGVHLTGAAQYFDFSGSETRTAADGSFVLRGLEAGLCLLGADGGTNGHARTELQLRAGEEARWDIVLAAGGTVAGLVLDERGAPLSHWHVAAVDPGEPGVWLRSAYSDSAGRFRMEDCPARPFVLALRAPEEEWGDPVLELEDFRVGDEALILRVMDAWRPSAFIVGRLVAADGAPLVEVELVHRPARTGFALTHVPNPDGRFRIGPLRSGEYTLYAEALLAETSGLYQLRGPRFALQAGETKDLGNLLLERCGWIHVHAVAKGGGALPAGTVLDDVELRIDGGGAGSISFEGFEGRSSPLGPGTYLVRASEGSWRAPDVEVEVRPGATVELEVAFEPATE